MCNQKILRETELQLYCSEHVQTLEAACATRKFFLPPNRKLVATVTPRREMLPKAVRKGQGKLPAILHHNVHSCVRAKE